MNWRRSRRKRKLEGDTDMALNEITAIMPIKTTGISSKIIFITKALKMIDATDDEYIEVTLRPFKNKIASCDEAEEDEERTEE